MKKTITVLAYNRPQYLGSCLLALSRCRGIADYSAIVSIDGGGDRRQVINDTGLTVICQEKNFGIDHHNEAMYNHVFKELDSEFNLALEDDVILTPDALEVCDWFLSQPKWGRYAWLSLGNYAREWLYLDPYQKILEGQGIYTSAWAMGRESWERMEPNWCQHMYSQVGWDWSLSYVAWLNQWKSLEPVVARARNIGRTGVHAFAEWFDQNVAPSIYSDGRPATSFEVIPWEPEEPPNWVKREEEARARHVKA